MSQDEEEKEKLKYDVVQKALEYGTIRTNALFEDSKSSLKISRAGGLVQIRIPWATIIWGGLFAIIGMSIGSFIALKLLGLPPMYLLIVASVFGFIPGFIGAKLGNWSPMKDETGEDLITYLLIVMRQKLSAKSAQSGKQSTCMLLSKAIGGEDGVMVKCTQWIGTQPLYDAPPQGIYADEVLLTDLHYYPRGTSSIVPRDNFRDGLGDRF